MLNIIGHRRIFLGIAGALVLGAIVLSVTFGFKEGIDFRGGTLWKFRIPEAPAAAEVLNFFRAEQGYPDAQLNYDPTSQSYLVRLPETAGPNHQKLQEALAAKYPSSQELSFQSIGPSVGNELRRKAIMGIAFVLLGISLYIAFAFRKVLKPVSSWTYGWITLVTLFHDVAIPAGLLAVLGRYQGVDIDSNFIVALLVIMGFSVHDTIVVFDRIRENLFLDRGKSEFGEVVNRSVNETLARSINTSLTLILVLIALLFLGPVTLRYFILTLLIGVLMGMYSSIFVASPLLLVSRRTAK